MTNISGVCEYLEMLRVSALKSVKIFGLWDQPRNIVTWDDVKQNSWNKLRTDLGFEAEELRTLQPNKQEWIKRGNLKLFDLPEMTMFPVNPYEDLHADLAEVWSMDWTVDDWIKMGIKYEQMKRRGLTPQIMKMMNLSLAEWASLDMCPDDVTQDIAFLFNMRTEECKQVLKDFT